VSSPLKRFLAVAALVGTAGLVAAPGVDARGGGLGPWLRHQPKLSIADATAVEDDGTIDFEVTLDRPTWYPVTAWFVTSNKSAKRGQDYKGLSLKVRIPAGQTSATASVRLIDDAIAEPDEQFAIRATLVLGARKGDSKAIGTIIDDALTVNLLHINDHHSNVAPARINADLGTGGGRLRYDGGGFPAISAKMKELEASLPNVVKVHAGDAITGTLFYSLFKGEADAALMNEVCFDIFQVGNHEFDDSDEQLKQFLDWINAGDCGTVTLGANVVPEVGTPLALTSPTDYIEPYVVKQFGTEQVGFVGINIAQKTRVSSQPLPTTQFLDEVETAQRYVDELDAMGVDNIVLVTHYTYENDLALAAQVTGVDAIIGGDSHTLLGDGFGPFSGPGTGPYPTQVVNADGDPVCVVQAWQYARVLGEFELSFDQGRNVGCGGTPHLLVSNFVRQVPGSSPAVFEPIPADELAAVQAIVDAAPSVSLVVPNAASQAILESFSGQVDILNQQVIASAGEPLCSRRVPDRPRSGICDPGTVAASGATQETNGGFIQQIVTDAFLARAFRADIALQNAGGVRVDFPTGNITLGDAYRLLPFSNTLVEMEMTGAEIAQVLEEAVANYQDNGGSDGSYPYGSAIRWDVDESAAAGSRFSNIEVRADDGTWGPIDPAATYVVVTNSFLSTGQDGWTTFGTVTADGRTVDTFINYAQGFIDWVEQDLGGGAVTVPAPDDFSTQSFIPAP
jgi:5'-nucleotidase / UDP-sugar diphosphatase